MATKVHMEALSPTMEEGQLVRWLKNEGDPVSEGDVLAEIETDKATMELVARGSGVLRAVALEEGGTAPVGEVIAVIAAPDEDIAGLVAGGRQEEEKKKEKEKEEEKEAAAAAAPSSAARDRERGDEAAAAREGVEERRAAAPAQDRAADAMQAAAATGRTAEEQRVEAPARAAPARADAGDGNGRVKASPLARRLARESGLDLGSVRGTGPGGRITKADIEAAVGRGEARPAEARTAAEARAPGAPTASAAPAAAPMAPPPVARLEGPDVEEVPVSQMRKTIAKRLVTSIGPVPTFYLTREVDMTRATEFRARVNALLAKDDIKASINDIIIKATASALALHPEVNASWGDNVIYKHRRVHIGVAVAVEDGLITPVVRDADRKRIRDIAVEVRELAGRAREKKLKPEEYTGATFSVSNLGMFGIDEFTAIINPPEGGILAVGRVEQKVVAEDGQPVVRPRMRITMSCDHRVIDGATGARFLQTLVGILEDPVLMLA